MHYEHLNEVLLCVDCFLSADNKIKTFYWSSRDKEIILKKNNQKAQQIKNLLNLPNIIRTPRL